MPFLRAPAASSPTEPLAYQIKGLTNLSQTPLAKPNPSLPVKPLQAWVCVAGWYGVPFDGRQTANGETFDMYGNTAAHPTLPLGSIIRVVDLRTKHSEIVKITDRGPFVEGRELDVSYEVAKRLGFDQRGLAKVRLEVIEVPKRRSEAIPND